MSKQFGITFNFINGRTLEVSYDTEKSRDKRFIEIKNAPPNASASQEDWYVNLRNVAYFIKTEKVVRE